MGQEGRGGREEDGLKQSDSFPCLLIVGRLGHLQLTEPEGLVAQAMLHLVRLLALSTSLNAANLPEKLMAQVSELLRKCVICGTDRGEDQQQSSFPVVLTTIVLLSPPCADKAKQTRGGEVASVEHALLATLSFVRGMTAHPSCAAVFCCPAWTDLLLSLVGSHVAVTAGQVAEFLAVGGEPTQQLTSAVSGSTQSLEHC